MKITKILLFCVMLLNGRVSISTPLTSAVLVGNIAQVRKLITSGVDVNAKDKIGMTALMLAAMFGHTDITCELLACGALVDMKDAFGYTALMHAVLAGNIAQVRKLITSGVDVNAKDKIGMTALMWAAMFGHTDITCELLACGALVDMKNAFGQTALMHAARYGYLLTVIALVEKGHANVKLMDPTYQTARRIAEICQHRAIVAYLVEHEPVIHETDGINFTPLIEAVRAKNIAQVRAFIASGADVNAKDRFGCTALMHAAVNGYADIVHELLSNLNINVNAQSTTGRTALMFAAEHDFVGIVRELLKCGAAVNAQEMQGKTALTIATMLRHAGTIHELLNNSEIRVNVPDKMGRTALGWAAENGDTDVVHKLLTHGARVDTQDKIGNTALMRAALFGHLPTVMALVEKWHANVALIDCDYQKTARQIAQENGQPEVAAYLAAHGG